jgi:hypothetical protein
MGCDIAGVMVAEMGLDFEAEDEDKAVDLGGFVTKEMGLGGR